MEIIHLSYPNQLTIPESLGPISLALGFFDGVHRGHQQVIGQAMKTAEERGIKSAVMTFDPHPSLVLGGRKERLLYITPLSHKIELLEAQGVDICFIVRFTSELANLTPEAFIEHFVKELGVVHCTAGFDYTFGKFGKGDMALLEAESDGKYSVTTVEKQESAAEKISSTRIRGLLQEGDVLQAAQLLGRPHTIRGTVVNGDKRGRTIGFPTANVEPEHGSFVPAGGVYAVRIFVQGVWYDGVCNIGVKPTFNDPEHAKRTVEVYILDFEQSIYGEEVEVEWYERIRSEQKFAGIDELKAQIEKDKATVIGFFNENR